MSSASQTPHYNLSYLPLTSQHDLEELPSNQFMAWQKGRDYPHGLRPGGVTPAARRDSAMQLPNASGIHQSTLTSLQQESHPEPHDTHAQYASYKDTETFTHGYQSHEKDGDVLGQGWVPVPLRRRFWIPFVVLLAVAAVGLEVALHFSEKNQGWPTSAGVGDETNVLHYVYTLPPVAAASFIVALWTWTDIEIKKMQPYVDLVHGDSPPHRSLLLDYTRINNFVVWTRAAVNKHYLVALATLMGIMALSFSPLAAALLVVKDTYLEQPDVTTTTLTALGLNLSPEFDDLTAFLTAASYASAAVLYGLGDPPFVKNQYTVAEIQIPSNIVTNGTLSANVTAMKTETGCTSLPVNMVQNLDGSGWTNSVLFNGCNKTFVVDRNATTLFGTETFDCQGSTPAQFSPAFLWFFTYQPSARASATVCRPSFTLWDVNINIDIASRNITRVTELRPFSSLSNFSSTAANITGPPLLGRAYNGVRFNLTNPDRFALQRLNATLLQLPAAVYQSAVLSPEGLIGSFDAGKFVDLSAKVYEIYLSLIARSVYFLPVQERLTLSVNAVVKRVWLSNTAVHLLAAGLFILSVFGTVVQLLHIADREELKLRHEPGTIASAVSIGAQTGMGDLLAGRQDEKEMEDILRNKKFRIDPQSMRIVMEGEEGYETAFSPNERRKSIFAILQGQPRSGADRRKSQLTTTGNSPLTRDD